MSQQTQLPRLCSRGLILFQNKIVLISISDAGDEYDIIPGGKVEWGETLHQTLRRECKEELGEETEVEIGPQVLTRDFIGAQQAATDILGNVLNKHVIEVYFICKLLSSPSFLKARESSQRGVKLVPLTDVSKHPLMPLYIRNNLTTILSKSLSDMYVGNVA